MAFLEENTSSFPEEKHKAATEPVLRKQAGYGENRQGLGSSATPCGLRAVQILQPCSAPSALCGIHEAAL